MTASRSTLLFLAALGFAAAALALYHAAGRFRAAHPDAVYTLTPIPGKSAWRVRLELSGLRPGRVPLHPPELDPVFGSATRQAASRPEGVTEPPVWWAQADESGDLEFLYEVESEDGDARHALLFGSRLFAVPLLHDPGLSRVFPSAATGALRHASRLEIRFVMPPGWDAYTPWGETRDRIVVPRGDFAALGEAILALGDFVPRRFRLLHTEVLLAVRGTDPAGEDSLETLVRDCLEAHAARTGPLPYRRALIVVSHPFPGEQATGRATANAVALRLSRDPGALGWHSTWRVVAHELFHFWNGGAAALPLPDERWFLEGASDYYALRALAGTRRLALGEFADEMGAAYDRLEGNAWADSSLSAVSRAAEGDAAAWVAAYAKGSLCAWALDQRLASRGGIERILRRLARDEKSPSIERALREAHGGLAAGLLDSLSGAGFRRTFRSELAAGGLRLERIATGSLTLGLSAFRPGTTEVLDLDPRGPAYRLGLRRGDRIVAVGRRPVADLASLAEALGDARGGPVALSVEREGDAEVLWIEPALAYRSRIVPVASPRVMAKTEPPPGRLEE